MKTEELLEALKSDTTQWLNPPFGEHVYIDAVNKGLKLSVYCNTNSTGKLIVNENTWNGWKVWGDGQRAQLVGDQWLEVGAPAGKHAYQFRYQPWDVPLGLFFFLVGLTLSIYIWRVNPEFKINT